MEETKQKPIYYVFCGIGGVLWDLEYAKSMHGPFLDTIQTPVLKPESVKALNLLLKSLEKNFDTKLIITSTQRKNLDTCVRYLSYYNLDYDKPIFATKFTAGPRGEKIIDFMEKDNLSPQKPLTLADKLKIKIKKSSKNTNFQNYVVLDNNRNAISKYIPNDRTIKTTLKNEALTVANVMEYLSKNGYEIDKEYLDKIAPDTTFIASQEMQ